jgi:hypothetical protein
MSGRTLIQRLIGGLALMIGCGLYFGPAECVAGSLTVDAGFDLFATTTGSSFPGLGDLVGVPLGGVFENTDTIIQRTQAVTVAAPGDTGTTQLSVFALQLETAMPISFMGGPLGDYFVTLQSIRGGPASTGSMNITFASTAGGTFTSTLDLNLDIRFGSLTGPIVDSLNNLALTNSGDSWGRTPTPGALLITGLNYLLNGTDTSNDFWPGVPLTETHPGGGEHVVDPAGNLIPEPSALVSGSIAILIGLACARWRGLRTG